MTNILVPATKPVVLVVDDVTANRELLEGYLYDLGYDVRQARDGESLFRQRGRCTCGSSASATKVTESGSRGPKAIGN